MAKVTISLNGVNGYNDVANVTDVDIENNPHAHVTYELSGDNISESNPVVITLITKKVVDAPKSYTVKVTVKDTDLADYNESQSVSFTVNAQKYIGRGVEEI